MREYDLSINTLCAQANQIFNVFPLLLAMGFYYYFLNSNVVYFHSKSPYFLSTSVRSGI